MTKRLIVNFLKYLIGFAIFGFMIWKNWQSPPDKPGTGLVDALNHPIQIGPFLFGCFLCGLGNFLCWVRWYILVRAQDLPFSFFNGLRLGMVGYFFSTFMPGSVGGDIIKATFIAREQSRRTLAVATVIVDRIVGLWGLFWISASLGWVFYLSGLLTGAAEANLLAILYWVSGIVAFSLVVWLLLGLFTGAAAQRLTNQLDGFPKVGHSLAELWRAVWIYRLKAKTVWFCLLMAIVGHICFVLTFYFSASTLVPDTRDIPSVFAHFLIIPIGMVGKAGVPLPGGIGVGELLFGKLYQWIQYDEAYGVRGSLVQRVIDWLLGFASYMVYLQMRPALIAEKEKIISVEVLAGTKNGRNGNARVFLGLW